MLRGKADRQEIGEKDQGKLREIVTPVEPEKAKRGDTIRIRLECTAKADTDQRDPDCGWKTALYPERDRASAQKALGKHAVERHANERKVKIVTERKEVEA